MTDTEILERIGRLEQLVDIVYKHLGLSKPGVDDEASDEVRALVAEGKTNDAMKLYRAETGADLASAKAAVDAVSTQ